MLVCPSTQLWLFSLYVLFTLRHMFRPSWCYIQAVKNVKECECVFK